MQSICILAHSIRVLTNESLIINLYNMMHEEHYDEEDHEHHHCMGGPMKKEFKLAKLEKKEKMLKAELEFIGKLKEMVSKMPEGKE